MSNNECEFLENMRCNSNIIKNPPHKVDNKNNVSDIIYSSCSRWFSSKKGTDTYINPPNRTQKTQTDTLQQLNDEKRQYCPICDDSSDVNISDSESNSSR